MTENGNNLLQMINPDYKPLRESSRTNTEPVQSQPSLVRHAETPKAFAPTFPFGSKQKSGNIKPDSLIHRAGDWVCLFCNNHNYSFREICNRCNMQSKIENLRQSLSYYQNQNVPPNNTTLPFNLDGLMLTDPLSRKGLSSGSFQTQDPDQSASKTSIHCLKYQELSIQMSKIEEDDKELDRKEFAFEKQLCFTSSDEGEDEQPDDEYQSNSASKEHEKRILKFLNFD